MIALGVHTVRWIVVAYMLVFLALTTWPGAELINKAEPLIIGLPFNLFAIAVLILGGLGLLVWLYFSEKRSGR